MRAHPRFGGWVRIDIFTNRVPVALLLGSLISALSIMLISARPAPASGLLQMSAGAADSAVNGSAVAEPLSPSGALFHNPAGLASFADTTVSTSVGMAFGHERIKTATGYNEMNDTFGLIPDAAISVPGPNGWTYGAGVFGSIGLAYEFPADPATGIDSNYFSECTIAGVPLAIAKRVNDKLWLGAEITPMLGYLRNIYRYGVPFHYKLIGPGVQGMVGATYKPTERWWLGASLRTPGKVWMDGSDEAPTGGRQDVNLEVKLPTQLSLGVEHLFTEKLRVMASVRYTDSSKFGHSDIEFEKMPVSVPFIPDALDEWRYVIGLRYAWIEPLELRTGLAYANRIVGTGGVSPLVYDNNQFVLSGGFGYTTGPWTIEFVAGFVPYEDRRVDADEAAIFPGTFESGGAEVALGFQRRF